MIFAAPATVLPTSTLVGAAFIGLAIGFLGGLLGKGGSAIATPLLNAIGVPAIIAVASPLPATIPSTLAASWVYWKGRHLDLRVVRWIIAGGIPATVAGSIATRWIGGDFLVRLTDVILVGLGLRLLAHRQPEMTPALAADVAVVRAGATDSVADDGVAADGVALDAARLDAAAPDVVSGPVVDPPSRLRLVLVAVSVGFAGGLLANSGGFLLAPLLIAVVRLPIRAALATSLAAAAVLAVPGTIVHAALGHIDWTLVLVFGVTSVPLSMVGARVALRIDAARLERLYGALLVVLGGVFLFIH